MEPNEKVLIEGADLTEITNSFSAQIEKLYEGGAPDLAALAPESDAQPEGPVFHKTFGELVDESAKDPSFKKQLFKHREMQKVLNQVGSLDLEPYLVATVVDTIPMLSNRRTKTLSLLEQGVIEQVYDWRAKIVQDWATFQNAPLINPDGDLAPETTNDLTEKYNMLAVASETLNHGIVSIDMVRQQRGIDKVVRDKAGAAARIRRSMNYYLIRGIEQASIHPSNIPQNRGLIASCTTGTESGGSADVTDVLLDKQYAAIINYVGSGTDLMMAYGGVRTSRIIRKIENDKYGGQTPMTARDYEDMKVRSFGAEVAGLVERIYETGTGDIAAGFFEQDMASTDLVMWARDFLRLGEFQFGGRRGPYEVMIPQPKMVKSVAMFNTFTLIDPFSVQTRRRISNLAT